MGIRKQIRETIGSIVPLEKLTEKSSQTRGLSLYCEQFIVVLYSFSVGIIQKIRSFFEKGSAL